MTDLEKLICKCGSIEFAVMWRGQFKTTKHHWLVCKKCHKTYPMKLTVPDETDELALKHPESILN